MAGDIKQKSGTSNQTITCSLAPGGTGLANGGARASTVIDNTTNLFQDALVQLKIKTGASGVSATGYVTVYAYASADGGTTYSDGATGSDAAITLQTYPNSKPIGVVNVSANATTYNSVPMSVAAAFGGTLPDKWGVIIQNNTGSALDTTEGNHAKFYQGYYSQYT